VARSPAERTPTLQEAIEIIFHKLEKGFNGVALLEDLKWISNIIASIDF